MPDNPLDKIIHPEFEKYAYASKPLVPAFKAKTGKTRVANLFMGEWMKLLEDKPPKVGRTHVRYRGGKGYVDVDDLTRHRFLEIFFIDVNQGDSILIQTPDDKRILIDGGESDEAHSFIRSKYNLDDADNFIDFEAVVATHSDMDHTGGLIKILKDKKIAVKSFYHNGLWRRKDGPKDPGPVHSGRVSGLADRPRLDAQPELAALMKKIVNAVYAAEANLPKIIDEMKKIERWKDRITMPPEGFVCKRLDVSDKWLPLFDGIQNPLKVGILWPAAKKAAGQLSYPHYGDAGKTVNGNSIVLCVRYGRQRILLTGDLHDKAMDDMITHYSKGGAKPADKLRAEVYKAAHHGSQHFSLPFLKIVKPNAAVISSGDNRQDMHGHPRAVLMGTITRYSRKPKPGVFSTELAACYVPMKLSKAKQKKFMSGDIQLYEKSIQGIVHLRSNKKDLCLGTVHGRRPPTDSLANIKWKWDIWPEE